MNTRSKKRILTPLVVFCIGAQLLTMICQFFRLPWYNVITTDLTAIVAGALFYSLFLHQLGAKAWSISYLLLDAALFASSIS